MRTKPYTARGLSRVPCTRCGKPSDAQWNVCAVPGYHGICTACDVGLNEVAMRYMRIPKWRQKLAAYARKAIG